VAKGVYRIAWYGGKEGFGKKALVLLATSYINPGELITLSTRSLKPILK
jgi:hypothetical protein